MGGACNNTLNWYKSTDDRIRTRFEVRPDVRVRFPKILARTVGWILAATVGAAHENNNNSKLSLSITPVVVVYLLTMSSGKWKDFNRAYSIYMANTP